MVCFFVFEEMNDFPKKNIVSSDKLSYDRTTSQSAPQNPTNFESFWARNNKPWLSHYKKNDF